MYVLEGAAPNGRLLLAPARAGGLQPPRSHPPGLATQQQATDIEFTDTMSGHNVWTQCLDTMSGHNVWTQCLDTMSGHNGWTQ